MTKTIHLNAPSWSRIILSLFVVWLIVTGIIVIRLEKLGAFASCGSVKALSYLMQKIDANPGSVRLNQSYSQWALALNGSDPSDNLRVGLGLAEGKGVSIKNISPKDPHNKTFSPYSCQGPGSSILIGAMIRLFGEHSVLPYFVFLLGVHFSTAVLVCILASRFLNNYAYIFGAGMLSLLCLPALDYNFGVGIFASDPLAAPFIAVALIALSSLRSDFQRQHWSWKTVAFKAACFGGALAFASYLRDIYTTFAQFCLIVFTLLAVLQRVQFKQALLFLAISGITLIAIQAPWRIRNLHLIGEPAMTESAQYGYAMWRSMWVDYKESAKWCWNGAMGLGDYLAPEHSAEVVAKIDKDHKAGSLYAVKCLINAIRKKPWDALYFRLSVYDNLWFGQRCNLFIYAWCALSTIFFAIFLYLTRSQFVPEMWLFPLFLLFLSSLIHYEHRYSQPFFLIMTPVTTMYVIGQFLSHLNTRKLTGSRRKAEFPEDRTISKAIEPIR